MTTTASAEQTQPPGVSYRSVWTHSEVRALSVSRAAVKMGVSTISYGTMVYLASGGAPTLVVRSKHSRSRDAWSGRPRIAAPAAQADAS